MKTLLITLISLFHSSMIFDFNSTTDIKDWFITNDVVMGGVSNSSMKLDSNGNGIFSGNVSTENNGGFAMTSLRKEVSCDGFKNIQLRIKGDGKNYQVRIKPEGNVRYWYIQSFETSGEWQTITLPLKDFYPSFRGRTLDIPNFNSETIEALGILIGNKKTEAFKLTIDKITLK